MIVLHVLIYLSDIAGSWVNLLHATMFIVLGIRTLIINLNGCSLLTTIIPFAPSNFKVPKLEASSSIDNIILAYNNQGSFFDQKHDCSQFSGCNFRI